MCLNMCALLSTLGQNLQATSPSLALLGCIFSLCFLRPTFIRKVLEQNWQGNRSSFRPPLRLSIPKVSSSASSLADPRMVERVEELVLAAKTAMLATPTPETVEGGPGTNFKSAEAKSFSCLAFLLLDKFSSLMLSFTSLRSRLIPRQAAASNTP